jgi:hypothetical protein
MATVAPAFNPPVSEGGEGSVLYSEVQTVGASHAQDIVFSLAGFAAGTKRVKITAQGSALSGGITVRVNDNSTPCTYTGQATDSGGAPTAYTAVAWGTYAGAFSIEFSMDVGTNGVRRQGFGIVTSMDTAGAARVFYIAHVRWPDTATAVTSLTIRGDAAGFFRDGTVFRIEEVLFTASE